MNKKLRKAKPLFTEERTMINEMLGIDIPEGAWIVGGGATKYIYLDLESSEYYIRFRCDEYGNLNIVKDNRDKFKSHIQRTIDEQIDSERERLNDCWDFMVNRLRNYIVENKDRYFHINHSGGKDSVLTYQCFKEAIDNIGFDVKYKVTFTNTSNEVADVYKFIKSQKEIEIINPDIGFYQWIAKCHNVPNRFRRSCCSKFKEGATKCLYKDGEPVSIVMGMRSTESNKRAAYSFKMDHDYDIKLYGHSNNPKNFESLLPICELENVDVFMLLMLKDLPIIQKYKKGHMRVGCCFCPYSNNYEDMLNAKFYPILNDRWVRVLTNNYSYNKLNLTHKMTLDEYVHGGWKGDTMAKKLLEATINDKNIQKLSNYTGLSADMSRKYMRTYHTKCDCGNKCNYMVIAMFYKINGRYENQDDNRKVKCRDCQIKEYGWDIEQWKEMVERFQSEGCELF